MDTPLVPGSTYQYAGGYYRVPYESNKKEERKRTKDTKLRNAQKKDENKLTWTGTFVLHDCERMPFYTG